MSCWNTTRGWLCLAAALLLIPVSLPLWANPLTLEQALKLAAARSTQLLAWDAGAHSANDMAVAAGQLPDPVLKLGVNNLPVNGVDSFNLTKDFMTMRSIGVMQEITRSDKRQARAARFEREADAATASRQLALANLQRDTAIAWLDCFYLEQMRGFLFIQKGEAQMQTEAVHAAYRGGRGTQADVFAARSTAAQLEDRIAQADQQVETARTRLSRWVGAEGSNPLATPPALIAVKLHPANLDAQLEQHPEIVVLLKREAVAEADAQLAKANTQSDVSVELMYSQRGPAYSNMVSLNVAIPLQWDQKNRQNRELAARLATVEQLRAQREDATRLYAAETREMLQEWQSNRDRMGQFDTSLLPLAKERIQAALAAYRGNTAPLTAVLEARRAEIDVRMERLQLEMATARLWAQIHYLTPTDSGLPSATRP